MAVRHDLKHSIINILKYNRDGGHQTRANRKERLFQIANQLVDGGYQLRHINQLKLKHVQFLVNDWLKQGLTSGTVKNRMTDIRWILSKLNKDDLIPKKNDAFNIPKRQYITNEDKSVILSEGDLSKITNTDVKHSLLLQRAFGLRREESIKIRINQAAVGDEIHIKGSWAKNGRPRIIKIHYPEQYTVVERVKAYVGKSKRALIPAKSTFAAQLSTYEKQVQRAGLHKMHGLRHAYAQKRYFDLTGWDCPAKGGPIKSQLNKQQLPLDKVARELISQELGHSRTIIVAQYCGH